MAGIENGFRMFRSNTPLSKALTICIMSSITHLLRYVQVKGEACNKPCRGDAAAGAGDPPIELDTGK